MTKQSAKTGKRKVSEDIAKAFFEGGTSRKDLVKLFQKCGGDHESWQSLQQLKFSNSQKWFHFNLYIYIYTLSWNIYLYIYICIFLFEVWTCSSDIPNNTKESFKRKAAMSVSRTRSKTTKVKAGYYSEETLRSTHKLSQSLVFDAVFVSKTISTSNAILFLWKKCPPPSAFDQPRKRIKAIIQYCSHKKRKATHIRPARYVGQWTCIIVIDPLSLNEGGFSNSHYIYIYASTCAGKTSMKVWMNIGWSWTMNALMKRESMKRWTNPWRWMWMAVLHSFKVLPMGLDMQSWMGLIVMRKMKSLTVMMMQVQRLQKRIPMTMMTMMVMKKRPGVQSQRRAKGEMGNSSLLPRKNHARTGVF